MVRLAIPKSWGLRWDREELTVANSLVCPAPAVRRHLRWADGFPTRDLAVQFCAEGLRQQLATMDDRRRREPPKQAGLERCLGDALRSAQPPTLVLRLQVPTTGAGAGVPDGERLSALNELVEAGSIEVVGSAAGGGGKTLASLVNIASRATRAGRAVRVGRDQWPHVLLKTPFNNGVTPPQQHSRADDESS